MKFGGDWWKKLMELMIGPDILHWQQKLKMQDYYGNQDSLSIQDHQSRFLLSSVTILSSINHQHQSRQTVTFHGQVMELLLSHQKLL